MKKLYRSRSDRKVSGVLGGLSKYLGIDASILRVLFVIALIFTGIFPLGIIYIIWIFLVPEETDII